MSRVFLFLALWLGNICVHVAPVCHLSICFHGRARLTPEHVNQLVFLNQARAWFLEITFMRTSVCVCVSVFVSAPRAIKNYSREMKSE